MPPYRKKIFLLLLVPPAMLVAAMLLIALLGMRDDRAHADLAVILGNRIEADGQPSDRLKARLDRALALYNAGTVRALLVSGGMGLEGFDEATVMAAYLADRGVPRERISIDSDGVNTWATAEYAAAYMDARGYSSAYAVSQYFHVPRSKLALRRFGVDTVYGAHPDYFEWRDIYSTFREVVAYVVYAWRTLPDSSEAVDAHNLFRD